MYYLIVLTRTEKTNAIFLCLRDGDTGKCRPGNDRCYFSLFRGWGYRHMLGDDICYFPLFKGRGMLPQARRGQMLFFSV